VVDRAVRALLKKELKRFSKGLQEAKPTDEKMIRDKKSERKSLKPSHGQLTLRGIDRCKHKKGEKQARKYLCQRKKKKNRGAVRSFGNQFCPLLPRRRRAGFWWRKRRRGGGLSKKYPGWYSSKSKTQRCDKHTCARGKKMQERILWFLQAP